MEYHLKKLNCQRGDLNLRRRYQSTALLSTRPSCFPKKGSINSKATTVSPIRTCFPDIMTDANFYDINLPLLYTVAHMILLIH